MRDLLDELARRSVIVVLDTPSLIPATDAAVLGNFADATLLVARPGKTRRDALESAAVALRQAGGQLIGIVLNQVESHRRSRSKPGQRAAQVMRAPEPTGGGGAGRPSPDTPARQLVTDQG